MTAARLVYRGVVYPWQCDAMGHFTTRFYMAVFDEAAWHFLHEIGFDPSLMETEHLGWADVRHEIEYLRELRSGELFYIEGRPLEVGNSSLRCQLDLRSSASDEVCCRLVATSVQFDLQKRRAAPILPAVRARLLEWLD